MPEPWESALDRVIDDTDFSGAVRVSRPGERLYQRASGLADRAHLVANRPDTQFGIASGVKGFTALAVMSLVVDGVLTLDTSIRAVLGDQLDLVDPAVTVQHLLTHTSGIGDYLDEESSEPDAYVMTVPVHELADTSDYLAVLRGHPMQAAAGERFAYCNGAFVILALVVEAVTGASYHDVVHQRVFEPAGMVATAFHRSDQLPGSAAIGYLDDDVGWRTNAFHLPIRGSGDGGAYSTLDDLDRFWTALMAGAILPAAVVDDMVRANQHAPAESLDYGLGFWPRPDRATPMLEGCDAGVSFRSAHDRTSGLTYTVVSNTTDGAWPLVRLLDDVVAEAG